ncbi:cellulase family glycosylhydrolase [Sphaerisporangium sp. B11E5]|uniref:cellulase family glycosylhydrolase n=1 Tax=Sphaerisporangium sp. B11E5 TaxID=3153563 RepID=UPI00325F6A47
MHVKPGRSGITLITVVIALLAGLLAAPGAAGAHTGGDGFVTRHGAGLMLDGKPFRFAGTNNYYLGYRSAAMVDDVFARARAADLRVLRIWGFLDIGNQDGSNSVHHIENGVYFQYWDGTRPAYNDGATGLEHLDYVLKKAKESGVKLVVPFVNNWADFGGIDQYVRWAGGAYHDEFYTDARIRGWYKDWISHLLNRRNTLTGVLYKDDPTVMAWELGNEPRCKGSGVYPTSSTCTPAVLTAWADEMSRHVKSVDRRHLVAVGDEGFYCVPGAADWTENCNEGVDTVAFARLPTIDYMSMHLYPDGWGKDAAWGTEWIRRHNADARRVGKPVVLGEFGFRDKTIRNPVYQQWLDAVVRGTDGFMYWMLAGTQDDGTLYPDYDGFTVYCPSPVCRTMTNAASILRGRPASFPPVADHDQVTTAFGVPVTVTVTANDIAYGATVRPATVDLDPAAAGRQAELTVTGGRLTAAASGAVTFTPAEGYSGRTVVPYTVRDSRDRVSGPAQLTVIVQPDPGAAIKLFSFEDGVQGWAPGNWQTDPGTVAQSDQNATDGTHSLLVDSTAGAWFGASFPEPVNLSAKSTLKYDLRTGAAGTSTSVAFQVGSGWTWCQSTWGWQNPGTAGTVEIDLTTALSCTIEDLSDVRGFLIWFSTGDFHLDNVRAE